MKNNIIFKKIWQDAQLMQFQISLFSESVIATNTVYTSTEYINDLVYRLQLFCRNQSQNCSWENGTKGAASTPYLSIAFSHKDKLGHILAEVYLEISDSDIFVNHHCFFYIETEIGLLATFLEGIKNIVDSPIGSTCSLVEQ